MAAIADRISNVKGCNVVNRTIEIDMRFAKARAWVAFYVKDGVSASNPIQTMLLDAYIAGHKEGTPSSKDSASNSGGVAGGQGTANSAYAKCAEEIMRSISGRSRIDLYQYGSDITKEITQSVVDIISAHFA